MIQISLLDMPILLVTANGVLCRIGLSQITDINTLTQSIVTYLASAFPIPFMFTEEWRSVKQLELDRGNRGETTHHSFHGEVLRFPRCAL